MVAAPRTAPLDPTGGVADVSRLRIALRARWHGIRYERCARCLLDPYHA